MQEIWKVQKDNLFLWVPFIMAAGGALYFSIGIDPHIPFAFLISAILFGTMCFWRAPIIIRAILIFLFGFVYACAYTNTIDTPILKKNLRDVEIAGRVSDIDYTADKTRIYISVPANELNIDSNRHAVVRISVDTTKQININDEIETTATLFTPSPADAPGGFDFARWSYFNKLTSTGYADDITITERAPNNLRSWIHNHTKSTLVDSLILGYKHTLPAIEREIWTSAGVGHVWSISGFHMTLIMGWLFAIFYFLFRLIPPIVKRIPAKHIAMICAWGVLISYVLISGASVATLRAFLMATLICLAALLGRGAFSLRNVCLAFCILFLINPYYIMTAGFQLSFSAIFGLVWFWNCVNPNMPENKIPRYITTAVLTAIIASIFTAPFIAAHFYSVPIYSIIGNLILLPIFSVIIMPLVIIGIFAAICGFAFPLHIADVAYNFTLSVAKFIAELPHATIQTPYISNMALCLIILGMMCVVLIRPLKIKMNYILGAIFIILGVITIVSTPKPLFMTTSDHELIAFVNDNEITFNKSRASNHYFTFDTWKHFAHINTDTPNIRAKHKKGLYIFQSPKIKIAYMQKFSALKDNITKLCNDNTVNYIVSYFDITAPNCESKILHDGFIIYENGKIIYQNYNRRWNIQH